MSIALVQMHTQIAGSKLVYRVNEDATALQLTIGGRASGTVTIKYRPDLPLKPEITADDLEVPADNTIAFEANGQGVKKRTFIISGIKLSHIEINDSGNDALGDFWAHISQWGQGL